MQTEKHKPIIEWATDILISKGYSLNHSPELVLETPWSHILRFPTSTGYVWLKQPAPAIAQEAKITRLLAGKFQTPVPVVIAMNESLHCFLMEDAGLSLRAVLKRNLNVGLLARAIREFTQIQRSTEQDLESFITLDVPDWRLNLLPDLYKHLVSQTAFLKAEGLTESELETLRDFTPKIEEEIRLLSGFRIPETIVQSDFNTNNILVEPNTGKLTFIDFGEIVITHPFFSLRNFLLQTVKHHPIREEDKIWYQLQDACMENWLDLGTKDHLLKAFTLAKKLWPIYSALVFYRFMHCVDIHALKTFYASSPNRLATFLREYIG